MNSFLINGWGRTVAVLISGAAALAVPARAQDTSLVIHHGSRFEREAVTVQSPDGGMFFCGVTSNAFYETDDDIIISKRTASGIEVWQRRLGGSTADYDQCGDVVALSDGSVVVAGGSGSFGNGNPGNPGWDGWVVKLDLGGALVWQTSIGNGVSDYLTDIESTSDGGFLIAGYYEYPLDYGIELIKLNSAGTLQWFREYSGAGYPQVQAMTVINDISYLLVRQQRSGNPPNYIWPAVSLLKFDAAGTLLWKKRLRAGEGLTPRAMSNHPQGGVFIGGHYSATYSGDIDTWAARVDANGALTWSRLYSFGSGGAARGFATATDAYSGGDLLLAGSAGSPAPYRAFLMRLTAAGDPVWNSELVPVSGWTRFLPWSVKGRSDGRIAMSGYVENYPSDQDGFVAMYSSSGTIAGGCGIPQLTSLATWSALSTTVDNSPMTPTFSWPVSQRPAAGLVTSSTYADLDPCTDLDSDGVDVAIDNCAGKPNPGQEDEDGDRIGSVCDNCATVSNARQLDFDADATGDVCDESDGALLFTQLSANTVRWQTDPAFVSFHLYRGSLATLLGGGSYTQQPGSNPCAAQFCALPTPEASDPFVPSTEAACYYLVNGESSIGVESGLGDADDLIRPNANPCP